MDPKILARMAHDVGLATWFGGHLMGAVAMNAATREVDDHTQRLRVANAGWFRWAPVVATSIVAHLAGTVALDRSAGRGARRRAPRPAGWLRAGLVLGALAATAETGRSGRQVVAAGDVPAATAVQPIEATPPGVAAAQRRLRLAQWLVPACTGALLAVNAVQDERGERGRLLPWG